MSKMWGKPSDGPHPPAPERAPSTTVRFRSGRVVVVVHPDPDELIRLWRDQPGELGAAPGAPRLLVVREQWVSRPSWPEFDDVTIDLNAIESVKTNDGTADTAGQVQRRAPARPSCARSGRDRDAPAT